MKIMTVEEILTCKIPEGDSKLSVILRDQRKGILLGHAVKINTDTECFIFSALYALAQGEYVKKKAVMETFDKWADDIVLGEPDTELKKALNALPTIGTEGK